MIKPEAEDRPFNPVFFKQMIASCIPFMIFTAYFFHLFTVDNSFCQIKI